MAGDSTVSTGGGAVSFNSTVDSDDQGSWALEVNTTGATTFGGAVGSREGASTDASGVLASLTTDASGTLSLQDVTTTGAQSYGDTTVTLDGVVIEYNQANRGAGIYAGDSADLTLVSSRVQDNHANLCSGTCSGGGIVAGAGARVVLEGSTVENNRADYCAGVELGIEPGASKGSRRRKKQKNYVVAGQRLMTFAGRKTPQRY